MLASIITTARRVAVLLCALSFCSPAEASHLVTGNGFGFAVVAPESAAATKFYPHPHSYTRRDPANDLGEGVETANFIKSIGWGEPGKAGNADYVADSHVIQLHSSGSSGTFFMVRSEVALPSAVSVDTRSVNGRSVRSEISRPRAEPTLSLM